MDEEMVERFMECTGDRNPVHWDEAHARSSIFGRPICHGTLVLGIIGKVLGNSFPGAGTIYLSQDVQFRRPLLVGDEALIEIGLLRELERKDWYLLATRVVNSDGQVCVTGQATVWKPGGIET